jgi:hypothetical protein
VGAAAACTEHVAGRDAEQKDVATHPYSSG